ncbi:hypothetical protein DF112_34570 [Burkholderia stagnalis]|uniref:hypothetical protein n=1 Tax=Burkholderia stagnalis TaxID=1503054 RepID=UPI000F5D85C4|nr:hypothetical protein [Burkholderia stagnalis]RQX88312.1 hypothetical protein DF119_31695 [Burkholderia stagnalis]RQY33353.1 hypothetical protein DF116_24910 [Burkholderia stagnalis]RQY42537.1 hypothetical protein DF112_34570 [Burkholderia stagnalis]RQY56702.1 hypothetical protein DF111_13005 [Burkholderia stagnalis]RQY86475.1 hypothetical protein DF108_12815 [Burkholderia stagnalis]
MSFDDLLTDRVSVLKADGSRYDDIAASVQGRKIFINQATPLIEPADLVVRKMSNGGEETFKVIDPGFHERFHGIPAGYQMTVEKLGLPEARRAVQSITYNVTGDNARINHHSVDNSTNVVAGDGAVQKELAALRREVEALELSIADRQAALDVVEAVDAQFSAGKPKRSVVVALLAALPQVANVATIASAIATFAH